MVSVYAPVSRIRFVLSFTPAVGVNVAVQVIPPSVETKLLSVPFSTVTSELSKPVTGSENLMVTVEVSPLVRAVSDIVMVAVGAVVSGAGSRPFSAESTRSEELPTFFRLVLPVLKPKPSK